VQKLCECDAALTDDTILDRKLTEESISNLQKTCVDKTGKKKKKKAVFAH
jgi:hypothetical protein